MVNQRIPNTGDVILLLGTKFLVVSHLPAFGFGGVTRFDVINLDDVETINPKVISLSAMYGAYKEAIIFVRDENDKYKLTNHKFEFIGYGKVKARTVYTFEGNVW